MDIDYLEGVYTIESDRKPIQNSSGNVQKLTGKIKNKLKVLSLVGKLSLLFGFGPVGRAGGRCELRTKLGTP